MTYNGCTARRAVRALELLLLLLIALLQAAFIAALVYLYRSPQAEPVAGFVFSDDVHIYVLRDGEQFPRRITKDGDGCNVLPVWSPDGRQIAFFSNRAHGGGGTACNCLYVMNADGSNVRRVLYKEWRFRSQPIPATGFFRYSHKPSWSPDGQRLAYVDAILTEDKLQAASFGIHVIDVDGSNARRLTAPHGADDFAPHWSADGSRILFFRSTPTILTPAPTSYEVWSIRPNGTGLTRVPLPLYCAVFGRATDTGGRFPRWSPDGRQILFIDGFPNAGEVWLANPDGTSPECQTFLNTVTPVAWATWSPGGTQIAFTAGGGVWRKSINSPHLEQVPGVLYDFDWSPVGPERPIRPPVVPGGKEAIACVWTFAPYESWKIGDPQPGLPYGPNDHGDDIFVIGPDGKARLDITKTGTCNNRNPAWSPDRKRLAFCSDRPRRMLEPFHIYTMDPDGRNVVRLTDTTAHDSHPAWSPDGQRIAFLRRQEFIIANYPIDGEIWVMNANGTGAQRVLGPSWGGVGATGKLSWSPTGLQIAYRSTSVPAICILDLIGLNRGAANRITQLTPADGMFSSPAWSTNPAVLAASWKHSAPPDRHFCDIVLLNAAGGAPRMVTNGEFFADWPTWSPDGTQIAYQNSNRIYIMNADGTGQPRFVRAGEEPDWAVGPAKDLDTRIQGALARVKAKAGDPQVSLYWSSKDDLDLHVAAPSGEVIFYGHRTSRCGGTLDVDMNVNYDRAVAGAVENVFWARGKAPRGKYQVYVDFFSHHQGRPGCVDPCPFHVRVVIQGQTQVFSGTVSQRENRRKVLVHQFEIR